MPFKVVTHDAWNGPEGMPGWMPDGHAVASSMIEERTEVGFMPKLKDATSVE